MLIKNIFSYEDFNNYLEKYKYIIINIGAKWCKPCAAIKPQIEKFITVINEDNIIYLKLDNSIYEDNNKFHKFFNLKKIPYFILIKEKNILESFVSGDFNFVSKKIFEYVTNIKNEDK
jgi:thiol-disulfide isomerase/thioredoxin